MYTLNDPRQQALRTMRASIPTSIWNRNEELTSNLKTRINKHPLNTHPIISELYSGVYDLNAIQSIHLEYRHAIVKLFTDALGMAQFQTRQLEPRLAPGAKIAPRFLLTLNALDEYGFQPGLDSKKYYRGNPNAAHYPLFERVLDDLKIDSTERSNHKPSIQSQKLHSYLEGSFSSYISILTLLAVAETQVIIFSPALRKATELVGINVDEGYYQVHGTTSDKDTNAADDDHEDDLWSALNQACHEDDNEHLQHITLEYLHLWNSFWDAQRSKNSPLSRPASRKSDPISSKKLRELDVMFS
ncbi:hypothetical protein A9Q99_14140 [Gammaproteobacteria bacterium 45_16_T64]|nr:hypothetical protein A9Q99_14140 [Gammaproteobacteria bacterium 45_16_T64]